MSSLTNGCPILELAWYSLVNSLQPETIRNTRWLNKSDALLTVVGKNTRHGEPRVISVGGCWRLGLTLGYLREGLELFALNWVLSGSRSNFMTGYFGKPCVERGRTTVRLSCNWWRSSGSVYQDREVFGQLCWFGNYALCSEMIMQESCCLSWSIAVTEWPCLMLKFCEILSFKRKVPQSVCEQQEEVRHCFSLSHRVHNIQG